MSRLARFLDTTLPILASIVFVVVWSYAALAVLTDSTLPADTWAWLGGLALVPAVVAWIALLPLGVFLWAWQADLEPVWFGLIIIALVGWTFLAWSGTVRLLVRRAAAR
ncbi:MAG: hypothetical protein AB1Z66_01600 [Candidatus Limnocylindrales bacterium]